MSDTELLLSCIAIFFLLCMSSFFSGSETALTAASKARMHTLEKEGNKKAATVNKVKNEKDRMIGALLLGNNFVNISSSALATSVLIALFGDAGVVYATAAMTVIVLIFGEVLPKTYAIHHADKLAMVVAPIVAFLIKVFAPITGVIAGIVRFILRIFGSDLTKVSSEHHLDVLRGAIDLHEGEEEGVLEQRAMLRSILDLSNVTVGQIMIHRRNVFMIDASDPLAKIIGDILESPYSRVPVWKDRPDNIVGIIHVKALLKELRDHPGSIETVTIESIASEPWFVPDNTTLADQLQAFRRRREHFALVVDEYGTLEGVVTLEDILEEIVGEIDDELDEIVAGVRRQPNGSYMIDGPVTLRDLNREFEWDLPVDKGYSTLAGLILYESQMVPEIGRVFHFFGFTFEVVRRQRNQITLVRVTPPPKKALAPEAPQ